MDGFQLWKEMVSKVSPFPISDWMCEEYYHRAASAWGSDQKLEIANGMGGWVDLTQLFEQYRMLQILKGNE